jgi:hypothetical protein
MKLATDRLIIRDFRHDDWSEVHSYASDPLVATHMIWGSIASMLLAVQVISDRLVS